MTHYSPRGNKRDLLKNIAYRVFAAVALVLLSLSFAITKLINGAEI